MDGGEDGQDKPLPTQVRDLENGIFNMVITLCRHLEGQTNNNEAARQYVASYLENISHGLRSIETDDRDIEDESR